MSLQIEQLIHALSIAGFLWGTYYFWSRARWVSYILAVIVLIAFMMNPIRTTMPSGSKVEQGHQRFNDIPERVFVNDRPSAEQREERLTQLRERNQQ